jgi:Fe-Mn family superoxide dismutase
MADCLRQAERAHHASKYSALANGRAESLTEHAYLQYQNRRPEYLAKVIGSLVNWDFASANFSRA